MRSKAYSAIVSLLLFCAIVVIGRSATITVTNNNDTGPGSLRQALTTAGDGDTITFAVTGTITLTSGGLPISKNVTISGPGRDQLSIDGNQALLVFGVFPDKTARISGLTINNGQVGVWNEGTLSVSDCVVSGNSYDGLLNDDVLTVSDCVVTSNGTGLYNDHALTLTVTNCSISGNSYGLYNDASTLSTSDNLTPVEDGALSVSNCVISGNSHFGIGNNGSLGPAVQRGDHRRDAKKTYDHLFGVAALTVANSVITGNSGPGVDNNSGTATIIDSTLSNNSAGQDPGNGGGINTYGGKLPGNVTVSSSTISGNSAFYSGGGISSGFSGLTIVNSTISGNATGDPDYGYGGGIAASSVTIMNSTVSGNSASYSGGGISSGGGTIGNTILNDNSGGNINGAITSQGYNVSNDDGGGLLIGPGDQINTDPLLGPLQDNGGPTLTHLPLPGSPAIDAGDPNFTPGPLRDQRGVCFYRVFGRRIDVGSVETQPEPRCPSPAPRPTP